MVESSLDTIYACRYNKWWFGWVLQILTSSRSAHKQFVTQLLAVDMDETRTIDSVQLLLQYLPVVIILILQASHQFNLIREGM